MSESLQQLFDTLPQIGQVRWIGIRPARIAYTSGKTEAAALQIVDQVEAIAGKGLVGDRYASKNGKRQVTLIQWEHLAVIASLLDRDSVSPELLRRNIAVSGINLLALKNKQFKLGTATLEYTGLCEPCSAIENTFGPGGYNAVRGHGGITCRIIESGWIRLGDKLLTVRSTDTD
jgi:MOSC domain-containing protein YiiM